MMKQFMRFRTLVYLLALGLVCGIASAQSTTVTGTVVDQLGNIWLNAHVTAVFAPTPNTPPPFIWDGGALNQQPSPVITNNSGFFTISLPSNNHIVPSGSGWYFTVCPDATLACVVFTTTIQGSSQDITSTIVANFGTAQVAAGFISKAYNINMVGPIPVNEGALLFNTTTKALMFFDGSSWQTLGTGTPGCASPTCVVTNPTGPQTITQPSTSSLFLNKFNNIIYAQAGQNIATLCTSFAGSPGTVLVPVTLNVTTNTTIPQNCSVVINQGGTFNISSGIILVFNGSFAAWLYQVFTGTGTVGFGAQSSDGLRPQWWGALGNNTHNDSSSWQAALDSAANSAIKRVLIAPGTYLLSDPINVTSSNTINHSNLTIIGEGRRGGAQITANTNGILFDLSGSAWTSWQGLYITDSGISTTSNAAFLLTSTTFQEALYNAFEQITIQLYKTTFSSTLPGEGGGTVGFILCGSEENTFITTQVFATTPFVFTTHYPDISTSYPSPFQNANVSADHSTGVNTFSGESSIVTFDNKGPNMWINGANGIGTGNMFMGNINVGSAGSIGDMIFIIGGTEEQFNGNIKEEGRATILHPLNAQLYGWNLNVAVGNLSDITSPWINTQGNTLFYNSNVKISLPTPSAFGGKPIWNNSTTGTLEHIANVNVWINQTFAQYATTTWPSWMLATGITNNSWIYLIDSSYPVIPSTLPVLSTINFFYNAGGNSASCSATGWAGIPSWDGSVNITFQANAGSNTGSIKCTGVSTGSVEQYYPSTGGSPQVISMSTQFHQAGGHWYQLDGGFALPTGLVPVIGTPTVGQASCIKSAGPPVTIGYCTTVVGAGGACTCN